MDTLTTVSSTDELATEQRLVSRVLRHWRDAANGQRFPGEEHIDLAVIGDDWEYCAMIRFAPELNQFYFTGVGTKLVTPGQEALDGQLITACPGQSLLGVLMKYLPRFQPNGGPLSVTGTAPHGGPQPVLFRAVLLPLASDGAQIDAVLCAVNFRDLHKDEDKELHTRLTVTILAVEKGQIWEIFNPPWGGWARAIVTKIDGDQATLRQKTGMVTLACKIDEMLEHQEKYRFIAYS